MWPAFPSNVRFTLHNFETLAPIDFPCAEREETLCRVLCYSYYTTIRPCQLATQPTRLLAVLHNAWRNSIVSNVCTSSVGKHSRNWLEIFEKLTMHLRSLRVLWFIAAVQLRINLFWDMALHQCVIAYRPFQANGFTLTDVSDEITTLHQNVGILLPIVVASWSIRTQFVLMF
jgi:hypothetical protein